MRYSTSVTVDLPQFPTSHIYSWLYGNGAITARHFFLVFIASKIELTEVNRSLEERERAPCVSEPSRMKYATLHFAFIYMAFINNLRWRNFGLCAKVSMLPPAAAARARAIEFFNEAPLRRRGAIFHLANCRAERGTVEFTRVSYR